MISPIGLPCPPQPRELDARFPAQDRPSQLRLFPRVLGATCLCSGHWGGGCLLPWIRPLHCAGLPSPHLLPLLLMAFLPAGVCAGPHLVPVGVPPPPNSSFLDRGTFVWGLDGEQGAFEWLAEDWGHGEGQGQERGGSALATSWTPGDPQHHCGGGRKAAGARPEKGCQGECWRAGWGREVSRSRLCWRLSAGGREKGPPPHSHQGRTRVRQGIPVQIHTFFMWVPQANSQSQALD